MLKRIGSPRGRYLAFWASATALLAFLAFPGVPPSVCAAAKKPLVVIDPGHGGHDTGVEGVSESLEKDVALRFARTLEKALAPECRVALTRTGDYEVSHQNRASMANHRKADLFISIHTGGFFRVGPESWGLFYYPARAISPGGANNTGKADPGEKDISSEPFNWRHAQLPHAKASKALADTLRHYLRACPEISEVKTAEAPLLLAEGLDMPAVFVEAGYLTNPACEARLNDPEFLADAAECIRRGIRSFLRDR